MLRLSIGESAVIRIRELAEKNQSGVYTPDDRQMGQIEVSTLILILDEVNMALSGPSFASRDLNLSLEKGLILTVSTSGSAEGSLDYDCVSKNYFRS